MVFWRHLRLNTDSVRPLLRRTRRPWLMWRSLARYPSRGSPSEDNTTISSWSLSDCICVSKVRQWTQIMQSITCSRYHQSSVAWRWLQTGLTAQLLTCCTPAACGILDPVTLAVCWLSVHHHLPASPHWLWSIIINYTNLNPLNFWVRICSKKSTSISEMKEHGIMTKLISLSSNQLSI